MDYKEEMGGGQKEGGEIRGGKGRRGVWSVGAAVYGGEPSTGRWSRLRGDHFAPLW